ncbi:hypothetical protein [Flavobacterium sp. XS2P39]|uniref:hypothetical protein n=1 Tax=Flavobacterium sp. XS2P39 TaxID=3401725 RepID=UPI003AAB2820
MGKHENKNFIKVRFPEPNYRKISIENSDFFYGGTNIFLGLIDKYILEAQDKFPEKFGNNNAATVLSALNKTRYLHHRLIDAIRIYKNENFIWVYDNLTNGKDNRILRLDLFRMLKPVPFEKRKWEFIGGILHVLKHFSFNGKNLSTGKDINDVTNVEQVIFMIIEAFYITDGEFDDKGEKYTVYLKLNDKYNLKLAFFREKSTNVYFINTAHKQKIKIQK